MSTSLQSDISQAAVWGGRIVSTLAVLFFLMDGIMKLVKPRAVLEATAQLGYPESQITGIGITLLLCSVLYAIPRTAPLGAILLTAYLGGAVASQVRINAPRFSVIFAIVFAILVWIGLWLRDLRVRALLS